MASAPDHRVKYAKDAILVVVIKALEWVEPIVLLPILTRALGVKDYGIWSLINVTISLLAPLAVMGMGPAIERFLGSLEKPRLSRSFSSILSAIALVSLSISTIMFLLAAPLARVFFGGPESIPFIRIAAFLVFLMSLSSVTSQYFVALRQIRWYSSFTIAQIILEFSLLSYLALSGFGLASIIIASGAIRGVLFATGLIVIRRQIPLALPSLKVLKPYLAFGLPLLLSTVSFWLLDLGNRYIISYFADVSSVGVYSVSYQLGSVVTFFWAPFGVVLLPAIAPLYEKGDLQAVKSYLTPSLKFFLALVIPAVFGISVLSHSILSTLTTPDFMTGYLVIAIVVVSKAAFCTALFGQTGLMLAKKTKIVSILYAGTALINLVLSLVLIPAIGLLGAAAATFVSLAIHSGILYVLGSRELPFELDFKFIVKSLAASLVMSGAIFFFNSVGLVHLFISIVAGAAIYFVVLVLLRGFAGDEYKFLKDLFGTKV